MQSSSLVVLIPLYLSHWLVNLHSYWLKSPHSHWLNVLNLSLNIGQCSLAGKVCLGVSSWFPCINSLCESCIFSQSKNLYITRSTTIVNWNKLLQPRRIFVCFLQVARTRGQEEYITYCIYKEYTLLGIQHYITLHWCCEFRNFPQGISTTQLR